MPNSLHCWTHNSLTRDAENQFPTSLRYHRKNRWTDEGFEVYANEASRIKLPTNGIFAHDFINANFISRDLIGSGCDYIATQAPMIDWFDGKTLKEDTISDFWNMIWNYDVPVIIMLARLIEEEGRIKAHQYWPDANCERTYASRAMEGGQLRVRLSREYQYENCEDIIIREMIISHNGTERSISQVHFIGWPDNSIPTKHDDFMAVLRAADEGMNGRTGPMTVHCSAGVGRTGTLICIHTMANQMKEHKESESTEPFIFDMFDIVLKMKKLRWQLVYNVQQYQFCYRGTLLAANNLWGKKFLEMS